MRTIKTVAGQTLYDLAITACGNADAAFAFMADPAFADVDFGAPLPAGLEIAVPETAELFNKPALRMLAGATVATT